MSRFSVLDSGPRSLITGPPTLTNANACCAWLEMLLAVGVEVRVPDITDYEVRRELLRANRLTSVQRIDMLRARIGFLSLTAETMFLAADFQGKPTVPDLALDGDVILAAQAALLIGAGHTVTVATTNMGHLSRLVPAEEWQHITV